LIFLSNACDNFLAIKGICGNDNILCLKWKFESNKKKKNKKWILWVKDIPKDRDGIIYKI